MRAAILTLLIGTTAFAAPSFHFGEPVPLTNTRYVNVSATATLISNGHDLFLLWETSSVVRITKIGDHESPTWRTIASGRAPVAVWTGSRFVIATSSGVRALDAQGVPVGPQINLPNLEVAEGIATNGRNVMVLARVAKELRAYVFDAAGAIAIGEGQLVDSLDDHGSAIASNGKGYVAISKSGADVRASFFDESGALRMQRTLPGKSDSQMAIASDGSGYLAAWSSQSIAIDEDGTFGATSSLAPVASGFAIRALAWTGDRYAAALSAFTGTGTSAYTAFIASGTWTTPAALDGDSYFAPSLALADGRLHVLWGRYDYVKLRDVAGSDTRDVTARTAAGQSMFRAISSQDATLVIWTEAGESLRLPVPEIQSAEWHMGVRRRDGTWSERAFAGNELPSPYSVTRRVATDGYGFVVTSTERLTSIAVYYDANGTPRWTAADIPFWVHDIAWTGNDFFLTGNDRLLNFVGARLSASGLLSPLIVFESWKQISKSRLATDGTNVFMTWISVTPCVGNCPPLRQMFGMLLDRDLHPLSQPVEITHTHQFLEYDSDYFVAWDGTGYTVAYPYRDDDAAGIFVKRVSPQGVPDANSVQITDERDRQFSIALTKWGTAILWPTLRDGVAVQEARLVAPDGSVSVIGTFAGNWHGGQLLSLPDGRLGLFNTRAPEEEPYFGSSRAVLAVGDVIDPARVPDAPKVTVTLEADQRLRVQWTAPPQPVNGYRVEYKIGKQDWLELEAWFRPTETTLVFTPAVDASKYSFRVRAWSDSGTSAYSTPVSPSSGKRRSVR